MGVRETANRVGCPVREEGRLRRGWDRAAVDSAGGGARLWWRKDEMGPVEWRTAVRRQERAKGGLAVVESWL